MSGAGPPNEPIPVAPALEPRPKVGYAMAASAAALWAVNGSISKIVLATGMPSIRLVQLRSTSSFACLALGLLLLARHRLRVSRGELPVLAAFGILGLALVQWFYFLAIHRLTIGIALLIEYLAPLLVAIWARYVFHEPVRRRIWAALTLAIGGLALIVDIGQGGSLSSTGVVFSLLAAVCLALYILLAEHALTDRDPVTILTYGFGFATVFWAIISPWWSFPFGDLTRSVSLLGRLSAHSLPAWSLLIWITLLGTIVPFFLLVSALRHLPATRVGIIAMLEPVLATIVAWAWLRESLGPLQLTGALIVLGAIVLAQTAR